MANFSSTPLLNDSGLNLDIAKLSSVPSANERPDYREKFSSKEQYATRVFDVPWSQRLLFMQTMLGYSRSIPDPANPSNQLLLRTKPAQHPELPWLYAVDCELQEGIGQPGQVALADGNTMIAFTQPGDTTTPTGYARYNVTYKWLDYNVLSDAANQGNALKELNRYVTRTQTYAVQSLQTPGSTFKFADGSPVPESATIQLPTKELTYTWHEVPDPKPDTNIETCLGKVNAAVGGLNGAAGYFDGRYMPGTLLMVSLDTKRYEGVTGEYIWEIAYKFVYRATGWNKLYRRQSNNVAPGFYPVVSTSDGVSTPYTAVDFSVLFQLTTNA